MTEAKTLVTEAITRQPHSLKSQLSFHISPIYSHNFFVLFFLEKLLGSPVLLFYQNDGKAIKKIFFFIIDIYDMSFCIPTVSFSFG